MNIIELAKQACMIDLWYENPKEVERFAHLVRAAALAEQQVEPVVFLANGTRFKMSFFENEDGPGTHVTCFEAFEEELDGRWVALVAAEDDCHRDLVCPQPAQKVGPDEEGDALMVAYMHGYSKGKAKAEKVEPMTDDEANALIAKVFAACGPRVSYLQIVRDTEKFHGIKEQT